MIQAWKRCLIFVAVAALPLGCQSRNYTVPSPSSFNRNPNWVSAPSAQADGLAVKQTSYRLGDEELPNTNELQRLPAPEELPGTPPQTSELQLSDVIRSVQAAYPLLVSASLERQVAEGKQITARGEFDLRAKAFGIAAPEGFYKTYRNGVAIDQPLFQGGYVYGGYKIGRGNFQPWFKERETDEAGEFSAGVGLPLLKDRAIDQRRATLFQSNVARQAVEPNVRGQLLEFVRQASQAYWIWVASGQAYDAQRELLQNAQERVRQIEERIKAGDLEKITRINNERLIATRQTKVIESQRKLQQASIKLSLFYRDPNGKPTIPDSSRLPKDFPQHQAPDTQRFQQDLATALKASPMLAKLDLIAEQVRIDQRKAENSLLPKLDAQVLASKDVGTPASSKGDKIPFELEAGFYGEVPLQRRQARGKIRTAQGKLAQIHAKRQFVVDKITAAVQDAYSALEAAAGRIEQSRNNLRLARETLELGRLQFNEGDIDLIDLNIYEKAVTDAQFLLIFAEADFFSALADYRAALALAPEITE